MCCGDSFSAARETKRLESACSTAMPISEMSSHRKRRNRIVRGWRKPRFDEVAAYVDVDVVNMTITLR